VIPPGPRRPGALQSVEFGLDPHGFLLRARERFGDAFTVRPFGQRWVVLCDPADVRAVFALTPDDANSGEANQPIRAVVGTRNVLLLDGAEHLARRRLVLPPFHGDRMRAYEGIVREEVARVVATWPPRRLALASSMQAITFGVILRAVFGVEDAARLTRLRDVLRALLAWTTDLKAGAIFAFAGPERMMAMPAFRRQLAAVDAEVLAEVRRRRDDPGLAEREDVLSLLLGARDEAGEPLTDRDLRDELVTLLVAGRETTAALLSWAFHDLARDPSSSARLAAGEERFADRVVSETLRLHPPVPLVVRALRRPLRLAGLDLPAGTVVAPCAVLVHRRPDLYAEPGAFRPDRFAAGRPVAGAFLPFGGGVRRCVGAAFAQFEARIVLEEVCRRFALRPGLPFREPVGRRGIVLVPALGARVAVSGRA